MVWGVEFSVVELLRGVVLPRFRRASAVSPGLSGQHCASPGGLCFASGQPPACPDELHNDPQQITTARPGTRMK